MQSTIATLCLLYLVRGIVLFLVLVLGVYLFERNQKPPPNKEEDPNPQQKGSDPHGQVVPTPGEQSLGSERLELAIGHTCGTHRDTACDGACVRTLG